MKESIFLPVLTCFDVDGDVTDIERICVVQTGAQLVDSQPGGLATGHDEQDAGQQQQEQRQRGGGGLAATLQPTSG